MFWRALVCLAILSVISVGQSIGSDQSDVLVDYLWGIGPAENLQVYRICVLGGGVSEYAPNGFIVASYLAAVESAYGCPTPDSEIRFLVSGGTIGNLTQWSAQSVRLKLDRYYIVALTELDVGYGPVLRLRTGDLVGYAKGDSIRFPCLGVVVDSTRLCGIVRNLRKGGPGEPNLDP